MTTGTGAAMLQSPDVNALVGQLPWTSWWPFRVPAPAGDCLCYERATVRVGAGVC